MYKFHFEMVTFIPCVEHSIGINKVIHLVVNPSFIFHFSFFIFHFSFNHFSFNHFSFFIQSFFIFHLSLNHFSSLIQSFFIQSFLISHSIITDIPSIQEEHNHANSPKMLARKKKMVVELRMIESVFLCADKRDLESLSLATLTAK